MSYSKVCGFFLNAVGIATCETLCAPIPVLIGSSILADAGWSVGLTTYQIGVASLAGGAAVLAPVGIITYAAKEYFYPSEQKSAKERATDKSSWYACLGKTVLNAGVGAAASTAGGAIIGMAKPQLGFMAASSGVGGAICLGSALVCAGGVYCCVLACGSSKDKATDDIILTNDPREIKFIEIQPTQDQMGEIKKEEAMSLDELKAHLSAKGAPSEFLEQLPRTAGDLQRIAEEKGINSDLSALENPQDALNALNTPIVGEPRPSYMS